MKRIFLNVFRFAGILSLMISAAVAADGFRVVTSTTMLTDMVRTIGGDAIEVHGLMGPGVDPHLYRATTSDLASLRRADAVIYNGLGLEGRLGDVFAQLERGGRKVLAAAEVLPKDQLLPAEEDGKQWDPHVWFSPKLWAECAAAVSAELQEWVPQHAEAIARRGEAYREQILATGEWGVERLSGISQQRRVLITSHDAFGYFGRAFDFEVLAIQGLSTVSEAGLARITSLSDTIRRRGIPAIFVESSVPQATIRTLSRDSGARVGGELFSDATGTPGEIEQDADGASYDLGTWRGMMRHNINCIANGLSD